MPNRRRQLWIGLTVLVIVGGAISAAILFRKHRAPDVVRLLPDSDAVLYVNLEPIRLLTDLGKHPARNREPEYEQFVQQTGFEFERDLDKAAFAIHYGGAPGRAAETRYSEILQGRFDQARVSGYLKALSKDSVEHYRDSDIYIIPLEGRTLRVALLGLDLAAASNNDDPDVIHGMIDRYRGAALPFAGPQLVHDYYHRVPFGSLVWTIANSPSQEVRLDRSELLLPGAWSSLLPRGSVVIASARPLNDVHVRALVIARSEEQARTFTERVDAFLTLFKAIDISMEGGGPDPDVKKAFDSLAIKQEKSEAVLSAQMPFGFFKKLVAESPIEIGPEKQKPPELSAPAVKKKTRP